MKVERNYGIDLLRIVSMCMIINLHLLGHGGILYQAEWFSDSYWAVWFLELLSYCGVNCFGLITGYVMYKSTADVSRILELWLQILFYSCLILIVMVSLDGELFTKTNVINSIFPITKGQYWYMSAYFGMYIFVPVLNNAIQNIEKNTLKCVLLCVGVLLVFAPTLLECDVYGLNGGYSVIWLCILYLIGGYCNKYQVLRQIKKRVCIVSFFLLVIFTFAVKMVLEYSSRWVEGIEIHSNMFVSYTSPTMLAGAVCLLGLFSQINIKGILRGIIAYVAPASLGVYMIHDNPIIRNYFIKDFTVRFLKSDFLLMILEIVSMMLIIYVGCSIIDIIRIWIFKKLKIKQFCKKIGNMAKIK